jgi:hypothetical protein
MSTASSAASSALESDADSKRWEEYRAGGHLRAGGDLRRNTCQRSCWCCVVEVSDDGVNFSSSYPGAIFDSIATLVPGDSQSDTIYVRNTGSAPGFLRITLSDVSYSDQVFWDARIAKTKVSGGSGGSTAISSPNPCTVTNEGLLVAPGQTVPVLASLVLGYLNGTEGQGATASLSLRITLSGTTPGALPGTNCSTSGAIVPVTPISPSAPGVPKPAAPWPATIGLTEPSTGAHIAPARTSTTVAVPPAGATDTGLLPALPATLTLDPNTWRLYQGYLVLITVLAAAIGAGISWFLSRRSWGDSEDA